MNKKLKKGLTTTMAAAMGLGVVIPAVPVIAAPATSGWVNTAAGWTYYKAGTKVASAWVSYNNAWYYIDANGIMATGWRSVGGAWYYMDANGVMQKGWYKDSTGTWYYSNPSGDMVANKWVDNYYLGASGAMLASTVTPDGWTVDANGAWDGHSKAADYKAATDAVAKAAASKSQADIDAAAALVAKLTVTADVTTLTAQLNAIVVKFQVSSVTALNASQLKVTFTQAVAYGTASGAQAIGNYSLSTGTVSSAVVQDDGKSVILNLTAPITTSTDVAVTVKNILLSGDSTVMAPLYTGVVTVDDTVAPDVASVTSTTNSTVATTATIKFTEPLANTPAVKIDGVTVSSGVSSVTDPTTGVTVLNLTGLSLDATTSHTLQVVNATDTASNVTDIINKTFSITSDTAAPQVVSLAQYADDTFIVKFNKDINPATVAANITVADSSLTNVGVAGVVVDPVDARTFEVKLNSGSLYSTDTTNNLTVLFKSGILDSVGNALTAVTKSVTLTQDTVAPSVTGVVVNKDASGNTVGFTVNFDSKIDNTFTPDFSKVTVVNSNGVVDSSTFTVGGAANQLALQTIDYGDSSVTYKFNTAQALTGKYGFTFNSGFDKDLSIAKNVSNAYSTVLDFGAATATTNWTLGATPAAISAAVDTTHAGKIIVTFPSAVKGGAVVGSATDPSNYTLNGSTLPTGTVITLNAAGQDGLGASVPGTVAQTIATINLTAGTVVTSDTAAVFTLKNIQRTSDSLPIAVTTTTIGTTDNTDPVLLSAKVLDNKDIVLTYSEAMNSAISNKSVGTEFTVYQNGTALSLGDAELIATRLSGYTNQVTLTVKQGTDAAASYGTITPSAAGLLTLGGTFTGTSNISYVVKVTADDGSGNPTQIAVSTDGGSSFGTPVAYTAGMSIGNGVTVTITGTNAANDTFAFTANAATKATTLDLTKTLTIKALAPTSGIDMTDTASNQQAASTAAITVTK